MGSKHSTLHRQLKQQDVPNCDLMTAVDSAVNSVNGNGHNSSTTSPYYEVKKGTFRRKLSVRNISIRRSFHMSKKHTRLNHRVSSTTDDLHPTAISVNNGPSTSTQLTPNVTMVTANTSNGDQFVSSNTPLPTQQRSTASTSNCSNSNFNRNGDKFVMDRIRKSFRNSFRRKKDHVPESIKPHQWQSDETAVKAGSCTFSVKYLGCVEVFESRGMQICEDALRRLRNSRRRPIKGTLYVTGDGLRVVDDETKGLLVDQTIEKVSFCAPDRSHERGFSYICRDGTTRRWMCHGFHATKDSGERLSHAVGCAFSVCLERKQRRDKEAVSSVFDEKTSTFTRTGSFRASSITERMQDPQVAKTSDPPPIKAVHNPYAVERPHAAVSLLQRQGSLRGGPLNHASPFKRQLSLRLGIDTLPSITVGSSSNVQSSTNVISPLTNSYSASGNHRERAHSLDFTAALENGSESLLSSSSSTTHKSRPLPNNLFSSSINPKVTLAPSVEPIEEVSPPCHKIINPLLESASVPQQSTCKVDQQSSSIAAMCQELSQGLSILSAKTDVEIDNNHNNFWPSIKDDPTTSTITTSSLKNTTTTTTSFSAFDKWISTNSKPLVEPLKPLIPPPIVDQMPQITAPPPPSSPPYSTTFSQFKPDSTDYHSSLFSDLTTSLKENLINSNSTHIKNSSPSVVNNEPTISNSIPKHNGIATTTSTTTVSTTSDPFDAGWVDLTDRPFDDNQPSSSVIVSSVVIPYKSTNPFLDLSQYETNSNSIDPLSSTSSISSAHHQQQQSTTATTTVTNNNQQMFTAFEVHM